MKPVVPDTVFPSLGVERKALEKSPAGIQVWMVGAASEAELEQSQATNRGTQGVAGFYASEKLKLGVIVDLRDYHRHCPKTACINLHMMHSPFKAGGLDPTLNHDLMLDTVIGIPLKKVTKEQMTARTTTKDIGKAKQFIVDKKREKFSIWGVLLYPGSQLRSNQHGHD